MMITGDNPLTACHVAKELKFISKPGGVLILKEKNGSWHWEDIEQRTEISLSEGISIIESYDLCITGEVCESWKCLNYLILVFTVACRVTDFTVFQVLEFSLCRVIHTIYYLIFYLEKMCHS